MATISAEEFSRGGNMRVVGNQAQQMSQEIANQDKRGFLSKVASPFVTFGKNVWHDFEERAENIIEGVKKTSFDLDYNRNEKQNVGSTILQTVGQVAGGVGDIFGEAVKPVINKAADSLANWKTFQEFAVGPGGDKIAGAVENTAQKYAEWKGKNPEDAKNLEAVFNVALLIGPEAKAAQGIEAGTKATGRAIKTTAAPVIDVSKKAAVGAAEKTAAAVSKTGRGLKVTGEGAYAVTVAPGEATAKAILAYDATQPSLFGRVKNLLTGKKTELPKGKTPPMTEAGTAMRQGLVGTEYKLGVQAKQVSGEIWKKTIDPALKGVKDKVSMPKLLSDVKKELMKISDLNRRSTMMDAYSKFADDFKNVSNVSYSKLQKYKEEWAKFVPEASYKGKPIGGALNELRSIAAAKARNQIHKKLGPEVKQAYIDYGNLKSIIATAEKSLIGDPAAKSFSRNVWQFVMNKTITPIATVGGQVLYKTGEGLEFLGRAGAKKVKDIVGSKPTPKAVKKVQKAIRKAKK